MENIKNLIGLNMKDFKNKLANLLVKTSSIDEILEELNKMNLSDTNRYNILVRAYSNDIWKDVEPDIFRTSLEVDIYDNNLNKYVYTKELYKIELEHNNNIDIYNELYYDFALMNEEILEPYKKELIEAMKKYNIYATCNFIEGM